MRCGIGETALNLISVITNTNCVEHLTNRRCSVLNQLEGLCLFVFGVIFETGICFLNNSILYTFAVHVKRVRQVLLYVKGASKCRDVSLLLPLRAGVQKPSAPGG